MILLEKAQAFCAVLRRDDFIAPILEDDLKRAEHRDVIVDQQDLSCHAASPWRGVSATAEIGRSMSTRVPRPSSLSIVMTPPCAVTIPCTTERPSPVPLPTSFVVKKGSKTRRRVVS